MSSLFFNKLPAELRDSIYRHLVTNPERGGLMITMRSAPDDSPRPDLAILRVCKQAYKEASAILYKENEGVQFNLYKYLPPAPDGTLGLRCRNVDLTPITPSSDVRSSSEKVWEPPCLSEHLDALHSIVRFRRVIVDVELGYEFPSKRHYEALKSVLDCLWCAFRHERKQDPSPKQFHLSWTQHDDYKFSSWTMEQKLVRHYKIQATLQTFAWEFEDVLFDEDEFRSSIEVEMDGVSFDDWSSEDYEDIDIVLEKGPDLTISYTNSQWMRTGCLRPIVEEFNVTDRDSYLESRAA